jgi:integrase
MKLDSKAVAALTSLPAGKSDHIEWCDDLSGFGLRLRKSGDSVRRTWIAQYRVHGRTRRLKIGAEKISADEARKAARKALAKVELGGDPQAQRAEKRLKASHNLISVISDYLADAKPRLRPNSYRSARLYLEDRAYFGPLHNVGITEVSTADVAARIGAIKRINGATTADKARGALSAVYAWAVGEGLLGKHPVNPVAWTNKPAVNGPRHRVLSDSELAAVWRACEDDDGGRVTKLLILTGQRRAEVGGIRWSEIDLDKGTWSLPASRTKISGHMFCRCRGSRLRSLKASRGGRDHLFGERAEGGFTRWWQLKLALDARLGDQVEPFVLHDLNDQSGHRRGVVNVYNKSVYANEVRAALALWADHLRTLVESGERKIVPLPPRAS